MKILMVAPPSLHFFSWADQLKEAGHDIYWFDVLDGGEQVPRISWVKQIVDWKLKFNYPGRYFIKERFIKVYNFIQIFNEYDIVKVFEEKLLEIQPDVVHSFAIQLSCIPILSVMEKHSSIKWVYSSWGSDLFYFQNDPSCLKDIKKVLPNIQYLFTDCKRDYDIAKQHGFVGEFLGVFPGNGGVKYEQKSILPVFERKIILIKGYNDTIGKGINSVKAITNDLTLLLKDYTVIVFGADEQIVEYIQTSDTFKKVKTKIYLRSEFIMNSELIKLMGASYIYIGNSISDGLPNALIEAIGMGAFPIQSNPGNVTSELINNGQNGLLIQNPLNSNEISNLIKSAILNPDLIEAAFEYNTNIIKDKYDREKNKFEILKLYESIS
jgi:glycosyltransferase involved in cell wall biosynthesis